MDLANASVLVTGGAGGFGGATARRLAQKGARVVIADVADERGEALAKEIGNGAVYVRTDILDEGAIANVVETAVKLGPLRAAVVVHGGPPPPDAGGRIVNREGKRLSMAHFTHTVNVFLNSAFCVTSYAAEAMAKNPPLASNQRGVIINTGALLGGQGRHHRHDAHARARSGADRDSSNGDRSRHVLYVCLRAHVAGRSASKMGTTCAQSEAHGRSR
jgi:NAD(P)-dependent dehydrogenase (short-subunit alcohol dehydrogenase family)